MADRFTPQPRVEGGRPGRYEFDKRREQVYRDIKKVPRAPERRDELVSWLDAHSGVEAYVEPKTVMSPKSVVLVDADGEWRRFELSEDRFLRELARERSLPIFDAARTGYPPQDASSSRRVLNEVPDGGILPGREAVGRCALEG